MNYESIPFQNMLLQTIKDINEKTFTLGYLHCAPWPIQTDLIFRKILLDKLLVSSIQQKKVLTNFLGWSKRKISVIPSLRFKKNKKKQFNGYIFLPFNLKKNNNYLKRFEELIFEKKINFGKIEIRIHPLNKKSSTHLETASKFKKMISLNKKNFYGKKKHLSFFFGSATGVCIQALEEGTKIIHFPDDKTDIFSNKIWDPIKVCFLKEGIFSYELKKYNKLFLVNYEKNKSKKYLSI